MSFERRPDLKEVSHEEHKIGQERAINDALLEYDELHRALSTLKTEGELSEGKFIEEINHVNERFQKELRHLIDGGSIKVHGPVDNPFSHYGKPNKVNLEKDAMITDILFESFPGNRHYVTPILEITPDGYEYYLFALDPRDPEKPPMWQFENLPGELFTEG